MKLDPKEPMFDELEIARGLMMPVRSFAVMDSALRFSEGVNPEAHQDELARLWADFSKVAVGNPHAWGSHSGLVRGDPKTFGEEPHARLPLREAPQLRLECGSGRGTHPVLAGESA